MDMSSAEIGGIPAKVLKYNLLSIACLTGRFSCFASFGTHKHPVFKVAVITKVSRTAEGAKSFALRCESGGVDFVEASGLRNVQMACDR